MIEEASRISDRAGRQKLFDALHKQQLADVPLIMLYNGVEAWANTKKVRGFSAFEGKPRAWNVEVVK